LHAPLVGSWFAVAGTQGSVPRQLFSAATAVAQHELFIEKGYICKFLVESATSLLGLLK